MEENDGDVDLSKVQNNVIATSQDEKLDDPNASNDLVEEEFGQNDEEKINSDDIQDIIPEDFHGAVPRDFDGIETGVNNEIDNETSKQKPKSRRKSKHTATVVPDDTIEKMEMDNSEKKEKVIKSKEVRQPILLKKSTTSIHVIKDSKGAELLSETKKKNKTGALKLINGGADVHFRDQTKCTVLHYAALAGYDDLIVKIISLGGNVKSWDCNGETPLHKAARAGHEAAVVALIANGADIKALNWNGRNPLELAVQKKHTNVMNVLAMCGVDLLMQEWTWLEEVMESKNKKDQMIQGIFTELNNRSAGFKHGGISYNMKQIEPREDVVFDKIDVKMKAKEYSTPFYFYCCKLHAEYANLEKHIQHISKDQEPFSDIYECRTWGSSNKVYTLDLKIKGIPRCNETLDIISTEGNIGRIDSTLRNEEKNFTDVTATISIKPNVTTTFMFVAVEKHEVFSITKAAVKIQPQMEPDAEINIPKGTFDTPGDLLLNVVETKDVNTEDIGSQDGDILLTNVLDLSMSNHQQPKQPIDLKLPLHSYISEDMEIVILSSSKDYPEEPEDWEIVDAAKHRTCASFKIDHFSIFTGVSKIKVANDMVMVTKMIQTALNQERQVEFFCMVKTVSTTEYALVVECVLQRKSKKRKKYWKNKGYESQQVDSMPCIVHINSWFRVMFGGNIKRQGAEQNEVQRLMFNPNRENFQIFSMELIYPKDPPIGNVNIELVEEIEQDPVKIVESGSCFGGKTTYKPRGRVEQYSELTALPVHVKPLLTSSDEDDMYPPEKRLDDIECGINVLRMPSLMQLSKRMNRDEIEHLAVQLRVLKWSDIAELSTEIPIVDEFVYHVMLKWRGKRPYQSQVDILIDALESMDKMYEADAYRMAHIEEREVRFT